MKGRSFLFRLRCAGDGLLAAWRRERSFRTQVYFAVGAIIVTAVIKPQPAWWALLALTIGLVLGMELINTALEKLVDHLHPAQHPEIKVVKDIAAGAVLIISLAAIAIGVCLIVAAS